MRNAPTTAGRLPVAPHVFISYAHADAPFAERLIADIERYGMPTWIDRNGLATGTPDWELAIRDAILASAALVLVASPLALRSKAVQGELSVARDNDVPIYVVWAAGETWSDCVPLELMKAQYADCRPPTYDAGLPQLIRALKRLVQPGASASVAVPSPWNTPLRILIISANPEDPSAALTSLYHGEAEDDQLASVEERTVALETYFAAKGYQIATTLGKMEGQMEFEVVHLAGYDIVAEMTEPAHRPSGDGPAYELPTGGDTTLAARYLAEILAMSLPANVRLVVVVSRAPLPADRGDGPASAEGMCPWIDPLVPYAPYVLTVEWNGASADDASTEAVRLFLTTFYATYLHSRSIEKSLNDATLQLRVRSLSRWVRPTLRKRARYGEQGRLLVEARIPDFPDSLTIDLGAVQQSLRKLGLPEDEVLGLLARKIRAHRTAFANPREQAILSIDSVLHGEFSWNASAGIITCTKLFRFRDDIAPVHWREWCRLLVAYNDLCGEPYRRLKQPGLPTARLLVAQGIHRFERKFEALDGIADALVGVGYRQAWMPFAEGKVNLETAKEKLIEEDYGQATAFMDMALSCLHNMVEMCKPPTVAETN